MRALTVQNRSTTVWLLGGLGVLLWAALSMLLSGSPASASQTPVTQVAASAQTIAKANPGHGQQNANHGNGSADPGHANRGHQAPSVSHPAPSSAAQPARSIAVKTVQAVLAPSPTVQKPGDGDFGANAQSTPATPATRNMKTFKAAPQRFAENAGDAVDRFVGHVNNSRHHRAGFGDSWRGDRGWHGQRQLRVHPQAHKTAQAHKVSHPTPRTNTVTATAVPQPTSATPQPVATVQAPAQPVAPVPSQRTSDHPLSTAAQSSGAGSILALEASTAAMPPTPSALRLEQSPHPDDVPPSGPVDSTESFPD